MVDTQTAISLPCATAKIPPGEFLQIRVYFAKHIDKAPLLYMINRGPLWF